MIAAAVAALVAIVVLIGWYTVYLLLLLFGGILLAVVLRAAAEWLGEKLMVSPSTALSVLLIMLVVVIVGAGFAAAPTVATQAGMLYEELPDAFRDLMRQLERVPIAAELLENGVDVGEMMGGRSAMATAAGALSSGLWVLGMIAFVLFVAIYLAYSPDLYIRGIIHMVPMARRDRARQVISVLGYTLRWWMIGRLISMAIEGTLTAVGLAIIGVPMWGILGLIAALLGFIPNIGPILAAIPGVAIALAIDPMLGLKATGVYLVVQSLDGYVITPLVQHRAVHLPPVLTITTQVMLGVMMGMTGLLMATPLVAAAMVLVRMLYVEEMMGDPAGSEAAIRAGKKDKKPAPPPDPHNGAGIPGAAEDRPDLQ